MNERTEKLKSALRGGIDALRSAGARIDYLEAELAAERERITNLQGNIDLLVTQLGEADAAIQAEREAKARVVAELVRQREHGESIDWRRAMRVAADLVERGTP